MTRKALERRLGRLVSRDPHLRAIRREAALAGVPAWLVGGAVRDAALGRPPGDADLAAGRGAARLVSALGRAWGRRGFRFRKRGVTTYRFDLEGRRVDVVDASTRGLARDLARRELTINAIAYDLLAGRVEDPHGGLRDLGASVLRPPRAGVVREDPVRALRAARFLAELPGFRLHRGAQAEIRSAARALRRASVERIRDEIEKLLMAPDPARGLLEVERLGLLSAVLPELAPLSGCVAGAGRPDVLAHTAAAIALAARGGRYPGAAAVREEGEARLVRLALLVHDVSKPDTLSAREDGRPTFHGHEVLGARRADALLRRLRFPSALRKRVARLVLFHLRPHHLADAGPTPRGLRRLVRDAGDDIPVLVAHAACDALASGSPDGRARWRRLRPVLVELLRLHEAAKAEPLPALLDGRDVMRALGIGPGPAVGEALRAIRELQEEGALRDRETALEAVKNLGLAPAPGATPRTPSRPPGPRAAGAPPRAGARRSGPR